MEDREPKKPRKEGKTKIMCKSATQIVFEKNDERTHSMIVPQFIDDCIEAFKNFTDDESIFNFWITNDLQKSSTGIAFKKLIIVCFVYFLIIFCRETIENNFVICV